MKLLKVGYYLTNQVAGSHQLLVPLVLMLRICSQMVKPWVSTHAHLNRIGEGKRGNLNRAL